MIRFLLVLFALLVGPMSAVAGNVDINTADAAALDALPGIGPAKARAIIEYRAAHGPFKTVDQLTDVPGIGAATLANLKPLVTAGKGGAPAAPAPAAKDKPVIDEKAAKTGQADASGKVNVNTASAGQLQSLPGIGATKAAAIVADREANGPFSSCSDLTRVTGVGPATVQNIAGMCVVK